MQEKERNKKLSIWKQGTLTRGPVLRCRIERKEKDREHAVPSY